MSSPNNCASCKHKQRPDGGHCYMFRVEPQEPCMQHTIRFEGAKAIRMLALRPATKEPQR